MTATLNLSLRARAARCVRDALRGDEVLMMVPESDKAEALQLVGDSGVIVMTAREIRPRWRDILKTGDLVETHAPAARAVGIDIAAFVKALKR